MVDERTVMRRWWTLQLCRIGGLALAVVAVAMFGGRVAASETLAGALLVAGAALFFAGPILLSKRWRSPDP